jgi:hypothetical protein
MPNGTYLDEQQLVLNVVANARSGFKGAFARVQEAAIAKGRKDNGVLLHDAWMLSLHQAFTAAYRNDSRKITIFGKPLKSAPELPKVKIPYNRGEYSFDIAVIQMSTEDAPYKKRDVPVVVRHLWQVESEMGNSAPQLSEDMGKLTGGNAPCKLCVTLIPRQRDAGAAWRNFIEKAARHVSGTLFVVMMQSYKGEKGRQLWLKGTPEMQIFRRLPGEQTMHLLHKL